MNEYIDKNAAVGILEAMSRSADCECIKKRLEKAAKRVSAIPTADIPPLVYCKNCNHYDMGVCLKIYSDGNIHPAAWQSRRPEDFCSYGERKEGADNG